MTGVLPAGLEPATIPFEGAALSSLSYGSTIRIFTRAQNRVSADQHTSHIENFYVLTL